MKRKVFIVCLVLASVLIISGCGAEPEAAECPDIAECPECPEIDCPVPLGGAVPFEQDWAGSGHADIEAEAFRHWDEEDEGLVSDSCVKCHSTAGYIDFHG